MHDIQVVAEQTGNKDEPLLNVQLCCGFVAGSTKTTVLNSTFASVYRA